MKIHQDIQSPDSSYKDFEDINGKGSLIITYTCIDINTSKNGPLYIIPRSHLKGKLPFQKYCELSDLPEEVNLKDAIPVLANPGDTLFLHTYTPHFSFANESKSERKVIINGFTCPGANHKKYPGEGSCQAIQLYHGSDPEYIFGFKMEDDSNLGTKLSYNDLQMTTLCIKLLCAEKDLQYAEKYSQYIVNPPFAHNNLDLMKIFIEQSLPEICSGNIVILPMNSGDNHWIGIIMHKINENVEIIITNSSLDGNGFDINKFRLSLNEIVRQCSIDNFKIINLDFSRNANGYDDGEFVVESLVKIAKAIYAKSFDLSVTQQEIMQHASEVSSVYKEIDPTINLYELNSHEGIGDRLFTGDSQDT